jgi:hypothetical protein
MMAPIFGRQLVLQALSFVTPLEQETRRLVSVAEPGVLHWQQLAAVFVMPACSSPRTFLAEHATIAGSSAINMDRATDGKENMPKTSPSGHIVRF